MASMEINGEFKVAYYQLKDHLVTKHGFLEGNRLMQVLDRHLVDLLNDHTTLEAIIQGYAKTETVLDGKQTGSNYCGVPSV